MKLVCKRRKRGKAADLNKIRGKYGKYDTSVAVAKKA
jgi:hypothetical protein